MLFRSSNIAIGSSLVFYDSLLPHIASPDEADRVSTAGYAIGYLGGGVLLLLNLAWILSPATFGLASVTAGIKASFVSVGVWWLLFSMPLFRRVPEPPGLQPNAARQSIGATFAATWHTLQELRGHRQAFRMLVAFLLYNDGIQTIIRMASIYGAEIGIDRNAQIAAFAVVQFVGVPFSFLFGALAGRLGAKRSIFIALSVYVEIGRAHV